VWFPFRNQLLPAFEFEVVEAKSLRPLAKKPLSFFQAPQSQAVQGQVFPGVSPQPAAAVGVRSQAEPPLVGRTMVSLGGDPAASRTGWVRGGMTRGNNAVVGVNPGGTWFVEPVAAVSGSFRFR
jgi:hypothetical protein